MSIFEIELTEGTTGGKVIIIAKKNVGKIGNS